MSTLLSMTRDEIMPLVWAAQTSQVILNVIIEEKSDVLVIAGHNLLTGIELGFIITQSAILDGQYRSMLRQHVPRLVELLSATYSQQTGSVPTRH